MTPLSYADKSVHPSSINEVTHDINPETNSTSWTHLNNDLHTTCKVCDNSQPKTKSSVLMPNDIQVHRYRHVPLNNAKNYFKNLTP